MVLGQHFDALHQAACSVYPHCAGPFAGFGLIFVDVFVLFFLDEVPTLPSCGLIVLVDTRRGNVMPAAKYYF